jgi:hypothetical protein
MKPRKTVPIDNVLRKYLCLVDEYKEVTGIEYDSTNGTQQVPFRNTEAWLVYGAIDALGSLLDDAGVYP